MSLEKIGLKIKLSQKIIIVSIIIRNYKNPSRVVRLQFLQIDFVGASKAIIVHCTAYGGTLQEAP